MLITNKLHTFVCFSATVKLFKKPTLLELELLHQNKITTSTNFPKTNPQANTAQAAAIPQ
jgi:hypothetical protein